jgi:hypothetical protein
VLFWTLYDFSYCILFINSVIPSSYKRVGSRHTCFSPLDLYDTLSPLPSIMLIPYATSDSVVHDALLLTCLNTDIWVPMTDIVRLRATASAFRNLHAIVLKHRVNCRLKLFVDDLVLFHRQIDRLSLCLFGSSIYSILFPSTPAQFYSRGGNINVLCPLTSIESFSDFMSNSGFTLIATPASFDLNEEIQYDVYTYRKQSGACYWYP